VTITVSRPTKLDDLALAEINEAFPEFALDAANVARFLQNPDNLLLLARCDDQLCGLLYGYRLDLFDEARAEVLLYSLDVSERFRRQGAGRQLVEATKRWAAEVGADTVWVGTERSNTAAMALYASCGGREDPPDAAVFVFDID
jgi:ribosomal protein S18 acetylase RimI-like enzyme